MNSGSEPQSAGAVSAPAASQSSSSNGAEKRRIVKTVEDVILYTDTDASGYPAFLRKNADGEIEITLKKRLSNIIATFYVKEVTTVNETIEHPLLEEAKKAIKEITKTVDDDAVKLRVVYEVYLGDMEKLIADDVVAYAIIVTSKYAPGWGWGDSKSWAIAYDWKKRIISKYPKIANYVYVKEGRKGPYVAIKLPIASEELARAFTAALAGATAAARAPTVIDLENQVENLRKLIKQKEAELEELKKQLEALETKLRLERLKEGVIA